MGEAVVFLFIKENQVLVEYRFINGKETVLVPGGGIDEIDKNIGEDYRENALAREIREELGENIQILEHRMVGEVIREETGSRFYVFFVTKWIGELPDKVINRKQEQGKLLWLEIDEALNQETGNVSIYALQKAKEYIESLII